MQHSDDINNAYSIFQVQLCKCEHTHFQKFLLEAFKLSQLAVTDMSNYVYSLVMLTVVISLNIKV